jgi:transcriptional regulator with XRE-family HTH domain
MAVGSPPTVRRRQLGRELRRLREESGLLAEQLAGRLRCSPSRISRIETARIRIAPGTVHEILDVLGVDGSVRSRLVELARQADEPGWWQPYTDGLPYEYSTYIALESEADVIRAFEPSLVYGSLQSEDYARAVVRSFAPGRTEARVQARLARKEALRAGRPPKLNVILDESVLRHVIGNREVLKGQLQHILELARLPNLVVQVLPFDHADVVRYFTGPAVVLEFADSADSPVVYLENLAGGLYVEKTEEIKRYMSIFETLVRQSLSQRRSHELIRSMLNEL